MSAEVLGSAAEAIRSDHGPEPDMFFAAVADLLDSEANAWEFDYNRYEDRHLFAYGRNPSPEFRAHIATISREYADGQHRPSLAVARAYLGESA